MHETNNRSGAGGGGGIGLACAQVFAKRGAQVALFDLSARALEKARSSIAGLVKVPEKDVSILGNENYSALRRKMSSLQVHCLDL